MAQLFQRQASAQVVISVLVSSSPTSSLRADSSAPGALVSVPPFLSAPTLLVPRVSLPLKNKFNMLKKKKIWV